LGGNPFQELAQTMATNSFDNPGAQTNQTINGTATADTLTGGLGNDTIYGGAGNDFLRGDTGVPGSWHYETFNVTAQHVGLRNIVD
jgi:Ca2+-binding RTX toxin-like protein